MDPRASAAQEKEFVQSGAAAGRRPCRSEMPAASLDGMIGVTNVWYPLHIKRYKVCHCQVPTKGDVAPALSAVHDQTSEGSSGSAGWGEWGDQNVAGAWGASQTVSLFQTYQAAGAVDSAAASLLGVLAL
eukprot:CAMPEP_0181409412 /NCGR_PEP_ID=MMETSP1110-20121109/6805_1 /TAXON_ID=174948 /ORGANISM="Symbiodinium sp., Strain CCMP421" /LENGTH=129 /DNA_ID=CAMNT_0023531917 /DNA_START=304 /DNA_END=692 /DNA_ORIENTATION=-